MRPRSTYFLGIILLLTACSSTQNSTLLPEDEVILETLVAQMVATGESSADADEAPPTETPIPAETDTPIPLETATPLPTLPPTQTSVPALAEDDPSTRWGSPTWHETFEDGSNWAIYTDDRAQTSVHDGAFYYTMFAPLNSRAWTFSYPQVRNFYLEVLAQTPESCAGLDRYGLAFRSPTPGYGYLLELSCDGNYRLTVTDENGFRVMIPWQPASAINIGPGQVNRMGIWALNDLLTVFINGVSIAGVSDTIFPQGGRFGLSVTSESTENFTIIFDNVRLWTLP